MVKPIRNILCYSHYDFDKIMKKNGWNDMPDPGVSCISICSPNEADLSEHWFKYDVNNSKYKHVFNLDIDDLSPFWFPKDRESECYDDALTLYMNGDVKYSNGYFNHIYFSGENNKYINILHAMDYEDAFKLMKFIDDELFHNHTLYIHCAVGASRSQGVVRYIIDTYGHLYDIRLNPNNPNNTYNPHVVMMLKRAYMKLNLD